MKYHRIYIWFLMFMLAIAGQACSSPKTSVSPATERSAHASPSPIQSVTSTPYIEESTPTPKPTPTSNVTPSPTFPLVTITAVNGDVAIRSGPDIVFDAIGALKNGETVPALARSILDGWVEVPIPSQPGKTGWISIKTPYSVVSGYVLDLPKITIVEWPSGSYIQNCTSHQMLVEPGDQSLSSVTDSPNNRIWFPPGLYTIYDIDVAGHPEVAHIQLDAHTEASVRKDGNGQKSDCP